MATVEANTLRIFPDFGGAWDWGGYPYEEIPDDLRADFENWVGFFESCNEFFFFDWKAYHIHGLNLAFQAKQALGKEITVTYEPPFEDPNDHCANSFKVEILLDKKGEAYIDNYPNWEDNLTTPFATQAKLFKDVFNSCYNDRLCDTKEEALQAETEIFENSTQIVDNFIKQFEKIGWHRINFYQAADFWEDSLLEELLYYINGLKDDEMLRLIKTILDNSHFSNDYYQHHAVVYLKAIRSAKYSYLKTCAYLITQLPQDMLNLPLFPDDPIDTVYDDLLFDYLFDYYIDRIPPKEDPTEAENNDDTRYLDYLERMAKKYGFPMPYHLRTLRCRGGLTRTEVVEQYGAWVPDATLGFGVVDRYNKTAKADEKQFCLVIYETLGLNIGAYINMQALLDSLRHDGEYTIFLNEDLSPLPMVHVSHLEEGQFIQWQLNTEKTRLNDKTQKKETEERTLCFARCQVLTAFNHFMLEVRDHIQLTGQKDCGNLYDAQCYTLRDIWLKYSLPLLAANLKEANHIDVMHNFIISPSLDIASQENWITSSIHLERNPFFAPVTPPAPLSEALISEFADWLQGYAVSGEKPLFDWQAFYKTGLELACRAKTQLGRNVAVKYIVPSYLYQYWQYDIDSDCLKKMVKHRMVEDYEVLLDINDRAYISEKPDERDSIYAKPLWEQGHLVKQFKLLIDDMHQNDLLADNLPVRRVEILNLLVDLVNQGVQLSRCYLTGNETLYEDIKESLARVLPSADCQWLGKHLKMMKDGSDDAYENEQSVQKDGLDNLNFTFKKSNNTSLETSLLVNGEEQRQFAEFAINIEAFINSLKQSGEYFIFTCGCGIPECAGIYEGVKVIVDGDIVTWQLQEPLSQFGSDYYHAIDDGDYQWRFSKRQLQTAVANALLIMRDYGYLKNRYHKAEPNMTCDDIVTDMSAGAGSTTADIWQAMTLLLAKTNLSDN